MEKRGGLEDEEEKRLENRGKAKIAEKKEAKEEEQEQKTKMMMMTTRLMMMMMVMMKMMMMMVMLVKKKKTKNKKIKTKVLVPTRTINTSNRHISTPSIGGPVHERNRQDRHRNDRPKERSACKTRGRSSTPKRQGRSACNQTNIRTAPIATVED